MVIRQRRRLFPVAALLALLLTAGVAYAAGSGLSTATSVGASQQAITSPCSSMGVTYTPSYSTTDGSYGFSSVTLASTCSSGTYLVAVAIGTGGSTYVEKAAEITVPAGGSATTTLALPSRVRVSDVGNIAVYVSRSE